MSHGRTPAAVTTDQRDLRHVQYRDDSRLATRARLHAKYSTAPIRWFPWVVQPVAWPAVASVLEVGCGPGWLWTEAGGDVRPDLQLTLTDLSAGMLASRPPPRPA